MRVLSDECHESGDVVTSREVQALRSSFFGPLDFSFPVYGRRARRDTRRDTTREWEEDDEEVAEWRETKDNRLGASVRLLVRVPLLDEPTTV